MGSGRDKIEVRSVNRGEDRVGSGIIGNALIVQAGGPEFGSPAPKLKGGAGDRRMPGLAGQLILLNWQASG